jgi:signal transduction histidine kinase
LPALRQARELIAAAAASGPGGAEGASPGEAAVAAKLLRDLDEIVARLEGREADRDLVSIVCHDLKEPLASIVMGAAFLRRTIPPTESAAARVIEAVARSADRMGRVVADFHDLAKLESAAMTVELRDRDIVPVVTAAVEAATPAARAKNLALEVQAPPTLGARCDGARLGQIVSNVLSNAVKFTPEGGSISVRMLKDAGTARVVVADTGCGIDAERVRTVLDYGANARRVPREGPGLGLAIAAGLAALQGGRIAVESVERRGTTVTVILPAPPSSL